MPVLRRIVEDSGLLERRKLQHHHPPLLFRPLQRHLLPTPHDELPPIPRNRSRRELLVLLVPLRVRHLDECNNVSRHNPSEIAMSLGFGRSHRLWNADVLVGIFLLVADGDVGVLPTAINFPPSPRPCN